MDAVNKLTRWQRLSKKLATIRPASKQQRAEQIKWLSYHIPKTAGTSFRTSLYDGFGIESVYGVYRDSGAHELSRALPIWTPKTASVLHGHFKPHPLHPSIFSQAGRITWLRDPVRRAWSLLNHTLDFANNAATYQYLKENYLDRGISDPQEIFINMLSDSRSVRFFTTYARDFAELPDNFFDFVGCTERYDEDLTRLSQRMQVPLSTHKKNKKTNAVSPPKIPQKLQSYFEQEYRVYERFTSNQF